MTDTLAWTAVRTETIDRFQSQTPRPEDEQVVIDVFEQHPQLVLKAIDETAQALAEGKITWAWSVLAARLTRGTQALREATVDTGQARTKAIARAKQWIDNAGLHYDRQDHVLADLFGDEYAKGPLTPHDTPELRQELATYWQQARPRGEQAERDHIAWNETAKANRHILLERNKRRAEQVKAMLENTKPTSEDIDFT